MRPPELRASLADVRHALGDDLEEDYLVAAADAQLHRLADLVLEDETPDTGVFLLRTARSRAAAQNAFLDQRQS